MPWYFDWKKGCYVQLTKVFSPLWRRLTEPLPSVKDPEARLRARWLASLLVILVPLGVLLSAVPGLVKPGEVVFRDVDFRFAVGALAVWIPIYVLSRTARYQLAGVLTITLASVLIFAITLLDFKIHKINYLLMPILFGSVVLPSRVMIRYIGANLVGIVLLAHFTPGFSLTGSLLEPVSFVGIGGVLAIFLTQQRARLAEYRRAALKESEIRYRSLFEDSPIAIWEEDFSRVKAYLEDLRASGVEEFRAYFREHPEVVSHCAGLVDVIDVNQEAVAFSEVTSKDVLMTSLAELITEEAELGFAGELIAIAEGDNRAVVDITSRRPSGETRYLTATWQVAPGYEETLSRCLVSTQDVTEQRVTEHALRESERRYRVLFENTGTAICVVGDDSIIRLCNENFEALIGLPEEEIVGMRRWSDFVAEKDLARMKRYHAQRSDGAGNPPTEYEFTLINAQGEPRDIYLQLGLFKETRERIVSLVDVTPLKEAEQRIRRSEERLRLIVEGTQAMLINVDMRGRITYVNEAAALKLGYRAQDLIGRLYLRLIHPKDRARANRIYRQQVRRGLSSTSLEFRVVTAANEVRWFDFVAHPIIRDGEIVEMAGFALDVTGRKQAEEQLSFQSMLLDQIQDMVTATDLEGRVTYVNEAECRALGLSADELIGRLVEDYGEDPERGATQREIIETTLAEGKWRGEVVNVTAEGREIVLDCRTNVIYDEFGEPVGLLGVSTDVTARREMERQLVQHERLAAVGQLAAGIAHDFRNLLSTIILYTEMDLRRNDLPPHLSRHLQVISQESHTASDLVQQILDFTSNAMLNPRLLDLEAHTEKVLSTLRHTIPENIRISLETDGGDYTVRADPARIQQALTNLVLNARDAMPDGGNLRFALTKLKVGFSERSPVPGATSGSWVCLSVSDTGMGMSEEVQAHLFEPFFTTKEMGKGTGLGLAQVFGIVRQHEGHIDVETAPGEGTTFHIYLSAQDGEADTELEAVDPSVSVPRGRGETILLVEDEAGVRDAVKQVLESLGYRVVTARHGTEALALCQAPRWSRPRARPVDVVITDLVMPRMGGKELLAALRRIDPELPVLAITGYPVEGEDLNALIGAGFVDVVAKPLDVEGLVRRIHQVLDA